MSNTELAKSVFVVQSKDTVAVKHYHYGLQRFNCWLIATALLAALISSYAFNPKFKDYTNKHIYYTDNIKEQYDWIYGIYQRQEKEFDQTYEEFFKEAFDSGYKKDLIVIAVSHTIWLMPLLLLIFWRAPPPVVFDKKRQLIYTLHWGKFYSAVFNKLEPQFSKGHQLHFSTAFGPLEISLFDEKGKRKRFRLGAHFAYSGQSNDLYNWLKNYMDGQADADIFKERKDRWVEKCPFPPRQLPQDKLQEVLANWPITSTST